MLASAIPPRPPPRFQRNSRREEARVVIDGGVDIKDLLPRKAQKGTKKEERQEVLRGHRFVILSAAKDHAHVQSRFFAALRMTVGAGFYFKLLCRFVFFAAISRRKQTRSC